ncbi:hypothetical protein AB1Y20_001192 [Prymnesium parvum]|uniref:Cytokinin riboside 5'-monophosphate phosphoribohydrolase n=1 Tax=Prymnesium parvum TaxID=97485 RepID=A0AB34K7H1_PRYPA
MSLRVCVYGSSSKKTPAAYLEAASVLGTELASRGHTCINGGGAHGVMGALNRACKAVGGRVVGVCHEMFVDGDITEMFRGFELVVTRGGDLTERKAALVAHSDCFIALPGGPGTWDELWEVACARQLGIARSGPICLLNTDGYYDGFVQQIERAYVDQILHKPPREFIHVVEDPIDAVDWCEAHVKDGTRMPSPVPQRASTLGLSFSHFPALFWIALGALGGSLATLASVRRR